MRLLHYTQNISVFLDFHTHYLALAVKSCIKDTHDFLHKLLSFSKLYCDVVLYAVVFIRLYPNNPHEDVVLKNNIFRSDKSVHDRPGRVNS